MSHQVTHPMVEFQRKVRSLIESNAVKPDDSIWKIALLFGDKWTRIKQDLIEFEFSMQDPIAEVLLVEEWEED